MIKMHSLPFASIEHCEVATDRLGRCAMFTLSNGEEGSQEALRSTTKHSY